MVGCPLKRRMPPVGVSYMAAILFLVFCDQHNHKGQNRKNDHEKLVIAHTLTPLSFVLEKGAKLTM